MAKKRTPGQSRRYKLHQKIKHLFVLNVRKRQIELPYDHILVNESVIELRDRFRYNIQLTIESEKDLKSTKNQII